METLKQCKEQFSQLFKTLISPPNIQRDINKFQSILSCFLPDCDIIEIINKQLKNALVDYDNPKHFDYSIHWKHKHNSFLNFSFDYLQGKWAKIIVDLKIKNGGVETVTNLIIATL
jgi:hypothetical protein